MSGALAKHDPKGALEQEHYSTERIQPGLDLTHTGALPR
jgi:hypothetical protein